MFLIITLLVLTQLSETGWRKKAQVCWENRALSMSPRWVSSPQLPVWDFSSFPGVPHFRLLLVSVVWKTLEADMRFSMYWPRTWFSDFNFRFSSLTASTRADRSGTKIKNGKLQHRSHESSNVPAMIRKNMTPSIQTQMCTQPAGLPLEFNSFSFLFGHKSRCVVKTDDNCNYSSAKANY